MWRPSSIKLLIILNKIFRIAGASGILALALAILPARAADLPGPSAPAVSWQPPPAAPYDWTGFYVGLNAGFGVDHFAFPYYFHGPGVSAQETSGITASGAVVGGQVGYNYQFTGVPLIGNAIVGLEADSDWSNVRGSVGVSTPPAVLTFGSRLENFGDIRLRLGYAFDRLMIYFATGFSYATVRTYYGIGAPYLIVNGTTTLRAGMLPFSRSFGNEGVGVEYALIPNWTIRADYMYDSISARYAAYAAGNTTIGFLTRSKYHIARFSLNYKFDWFSPPAAVTAKY
jgi:outer membrane immunogenic protein